MWCVHIEKWQRVTDTRKWYISSTLYWSRGPKVSLVAKLMLPVTTNKFFFLNSFKSICLHFFFLVYLFFSVIFISNSIWHLNTTIIREKISKIALQPARHCHSMYIGKFCKKFKNRKNGYGCGREIRYETVILKRYRPLKQNFSSNFIIFFILLLFYSLPRVCAYVWTCTYSMLNTAHTQPTHTHTYIHIHAHACIYTEKCWRISHRTT